ncbi:MAG TPA: HEAT repeat domain-containing protein [Cyclobacteriaceae bacterium]|nr:HEAT repeat domain-containing protein [Cyclobacteriaceae bacterium]
MEKNRIDELVAKYNEGLADPSEIRTLELLIEEGRLDLTHLHNLDALDKQIMEAEVPVPSMKLNDKFYAMLADEKKKSSRKFSFQLPEWSYLMPRLAVLATMLLVGFAGGYFLQRPATSSGEVAQLQDQIGELKEMMMLSLLEKESASERLRAVSLTNDMAQASDKVTKALLETLNHDPNENVRLAALEALTPYVSQSAIRMALIRSIANQESPVVQVSLAELMVAIQEKKSVGELQKLMDSDKTPADVKKEIKKSIDVLI